MSNIMSYVTYYVSKSDLPIYNHCLFVQTFSYVYIRAFWAIPLAFESANKTHYTEENSSYYIILSTAWILSAVSIAISIKLLKKCHSVIWNEIYPQIRHDR